MKSVLRSYEREPSNNLVLGYRSDLSSERASHRDNTATFRQNIISGHRFQSKLDTKTN
jgi:hypothetical protein